MPLSHRDQRDLRATLEALTHELAAALADTAQAARPVELDQPAIGRVSRIDAIQQQKMLEAHRTAQQGRLAQARAALRRFDEGSFGECLGCGEEITLARLHAKPESALCIECQRGQEQS